jgi:hypothetical protein
LLLDARNEVRRRFQIKRDDNRAAQEAAIETRDPLRTVLTPEKHAVSRADVSPFKLTSKLKRSGSETRVGTA